MAPEFYSTPSTSILYTIGRVFINASFAWYPFAKCWKHHIFVSSCLYGGKAGTPSFRHFTKRRRPYFALKGSIIIRLQNRALQIDGNGIKLLHFPPALLLPVHPHYTLLHLQNRVPVYMMFNTYLIVNITALILSIWLFQRMDRTLRFHNTPLAVYSRFLLIFNWRKIKHYT